MFLVIGTSTLDISISGFDSLPEIQGDEFTSDSLVFCRNPIQMNIGGNGANSAYVLAKLGQTVHLFSAIGEDVQSEMLSRWLHEAGVGLDGLNRSQTSRTSVTAVVTDGSQNRLAFHHHGASAEIIPDDIPLPMLQQAQFLLFSGYPLLTAWDPLALATLMQSAGESDVVTCLDIGPLVGEPIGMEHLSPALGHVTYFLCNEFELLTITEQKTIEDALYVCFEQGASTVILKRGADGAQIARSDEELPAPIPAFPVNTESTVGAGDSFNSGFLCGLSKGWSLERSVRLGNAVAAIVLSSGRGVLGAPGFERAEQYIENHTNRRR